MAEFLSPLTPAMRFWRLLKPDQSEIRNVYVYSVFKALVNLSLPLGIQAIINLIQGGRVSTSWIVLVCIVVLGIIISGILQLLQMRITENLQQKIFARAAFEFSFRIPRVRMEALYRHYAPELMNRFFDIITVQKGLSKLLIDVSTTTLYVVLGLILLSFYHPFFILFSLVLVLLVYSIFRLTLKRGLETSLVESKHKYRLVHWLEELARTNTTFKLAGITHLPQEKADVHVGEYLKARENHFSVLVEQYSLMLAFKAIVSTGLLAIGGILVMNQQMNIGQFVAAEIIIITVLAAVEKLVLSLETVYDVLTSLEKIGEVTDLELEELDGRVITPLDESKGLAVALQDVRFRYPKEEKAVFDHFNLDIQPGERVLIQGGSSSGKSTLLHIIAGLYDVQQGNVVYDGLPKGNLESSALRCAIGDCLIDEQLFEGTVLENISIGRPNASFDQIQWAVAHLGLTEFIRSLPKGYDSMLEPQGKKLPRSIVQKLLIARSIAVKPRLLILEYPFMNLPDEERNQIIDFLVHPDRPWTLLAVSPSDYLNSKALRVITLEDGKIISDSRPGAATIQ